MSDNKHEQWMENAPECPSDDEVIRAKKVKIAKLEAANKVLREALEFYRDEENWEDGCLEYTADDDIEGLTKTIDEGDTARKALKAADEIERG